MKRWQKVILILLGAVVLSQLPFAYRRYKLGRLATAIQHLNASRSPDSQPNDFTEYKGVLHVHSFLGGHSTGDFSSIINAAIANELDFVVMTEHPARHFSTADMTLKGQHAGITFVNGNEVSTANGDRLLVLPGNEDAGRAGTLSIRDVISKEKERGSLSFVAYPEEFKSWSEQYDGVEVYNVYTNARRLNPLVMFFDALWSYRSYPELLFSTFYRRPAESLKLWDEAIARRGGRVVGVAGNDSHANIGLSLRDSAGKTLLGLQLDPYVRSFRLVRIHVLIPANEPLNNESLLKALAAGHVYIGFDLFGDSSGFSFTATSTNEQRKIQGDEISLDDGEINLRVHSPVPSRILLFRDGKILRDENGSQTKEFVVSERGAYRVEVYLPQLPSPLKDQPWIISNPIYVR